MSSSCSITDSPNSSESLNGLTIGHKIYFEDVGLAVAQPSMSKSGYDAIGASPTKKMKGVAQGLVMQQPPRCQVEGCNVDLSGVKAYYGRHKVCILHSKSAVVVVGGIQKRFCQQCSRFHQLPEFDQEKRSCRRRLAGHNERRRKPPPMSFLPSHYESSSIFDTNNQGRGFLLDFSKNSKIPDMDRHHAKSSDMRSVLETQATGKFLMHPWTNSYENPHSGNFYHNAGSGTTFPCQEIPSGEYYNGGDASNRALSLLSSEPWASAKNRVGSNLEQLSSNLITPHNSSVANHIPSGFWGCNGNEQPLVTNLYSGEPGANLQEGRQDLRGELSSRFYESVQQMHWSR